MTLKKRFLEQINIIEFLLSENISEDVRKSLSNLKQLANSLSRESKEVEMNYVAKEYYQLLKEAKTSDSKRLEEIKIKLDELSAPYSDNIAYHTFLELERKSAGLDTVNTSINDYYDTVDQEV